MTNEEKQKYKELRNKIIDGLITKEEAVAEYMNLGNSREMAELGYFEIMSDVNKARLNLE